MTLRRKQQCSAILLKTRLGECYLTVFFDVDSIAVGFRILSDRPRSHPVQYYSFFTFVCIYLTFILKNGPFMYNGSNDFTRRGVAICLRKHAKIFTKSKKI